MMRALLLGCVCLLLAGCDRAKHIGRPPAFTAVEDSPEEVAMRNPDLSNTVERSLRPDRASLWRRGRHSLLGDRRAMRRGDILTVVIEIDEEAEISNSTSRSRQGSESLGIPQLFGLPQRIDEDLPDGASMGEAVSINSSSEAGGDGSVSRREELTLRVAATITRVLPNGVLEISGAQEVRVNFEMRELLVSGFVRPADISRRNEITYDKIAAARISYGGRGQISDMQQPRLGQQVLDAILPF